MKGLGLRRPSNGVIEVATTRSLPVWTFHDFDGPRWRHLLLHWAMVDFALRIAGCSSKDRSDRRPRIEEERARQDNILKNWRRRRNSFTGRLRKRVSSARGRVRSSCLSYVERLAASPRRLAQRLRLRSRTLDLRHGHQAVCRAPCAKIEFTEIGADGKPIDGGVKDDYD